MSEWTSLKIELIATGDQSGLWGDTTNNNFKYAIEEAITGSGDVTFASNNQTLILTNSNLSQTGRKLRLNLTGTTGGSPRNLFVPAIQKQYIINNSCADSILVTNGADPTPTGTGVTVPAGKSLIVFNNGTNITAVVNYAPSMALGSALPITSGGTGQTTANSALNALLPSQSTYAGKFLTTDGSNTSWADNPLGSVTSVSVVSANGLAGSVTNPTTTPALTLSTTITGVLKGNGTAISAASSGTDYAPATSGTTILAGNGSGGFSNLPSPSAGFLQWTGAAYIWNTAIGSGSVTSVSGSGGTTGLTLSGGPITTIGTLTLGGTLNVLNGGTGETSFTNNGALFANGTGTAISSGTLPILSGGTGITTVPTNGQLLIGNGTGYTVATLTQGLGINITNGAGAITISATSLGPSTAKTYFMAQF
jgi:hypothetical protein